MPPDSDDEQDKQEEQVVPSTFTLGALPHLADLTIQRNKWRANEVAHSATCTYDFGRGPVLPEMRKIVSALLDW